MTGNPRRIPLWLVPLVDSVRTAREQVKLLLRSFPWRSRAVTLRVVYVCRSLRTPRGPARSVIFLHHSYYHFFYLAKALRRRGWDAVTVCLEGPEGSHALYSHGEDINLYSRYQATDYSISQSDYNIRKFYAHSLGRFHLMHFAGDGLFSFFREGWGWTPELSSDMAAWKRNGKKLAYSISGCNSGISQTAIRHWSADNQGSTVCDKCAWQNRPDICSDEKNLVWGRKVTENCDLVFSETLPALDFMDADNVVREPTTMCLDPSVWSPDLSIPDEMRLAKKTGEFLVYHGVGNYSSRTVNKKNVKGTQAIVEAVDRLKKEGVPVRLVFATDLPNRQVRYLQVQCDVIVDQLNFGRYGATAREGMMLGKPTVCFLNPRESTPDRELSSLKELPCLSATEETVYAELKTLLRLPRYREELGARGRAYALKWHAADACAERYERLYDHIMQGLPVRSMYRLEDKMTQEHDSYLVGK